MKVMTMGIDLAKISSRFTVGVSTAKRCCRGDLRAMARPNMKFASTKNVEQQAMLTLHRARQSSENVRTSQANQIRELLNEFGLITPQGIGNIAKPVPELIYQ